MSTFYRSPDLAISIPNMRSHAPDPTGFQSGWTPPMGWGRLMIRARLQAPAIHVKIPDHTLSWSPSGTCQSKYAVPHCRNSAISSSAFSYIAILFPFLSVILRAPSSPSYPKRQKSETSASLFSLIQFTAYTVRSWPCALPVQPAFPHIRGGQRGHRLRSFLPLHQADQKRRCPAARR